jgi:hypothetical protein
MPKRSSKGRRDVSTLAKAIADQATDATPEQPEDVKNPAAVALGRLGGRKGGQARAKSLTAERRSEIAKKAAIARWKAKSD